MMIKKIFLISIASILLFASCDDRKALSSYLEEHSRRIAACDSLVVSILNQNIATASALLSSMNRGLYVTKVVDTANGKTIYFSDGSSYKVYNGKNGNNGPEGDKGVTEYPKVSVTRIDSTYWYWTVNGELLKDGSGNYVRADALNNYLPLLKIDNGWWVTSSDGGVTWQRLCEADENQIYQGGDFSLAEVTVDDDCVTVDLGDGTVFTFRMYNPELELQARIDKGAEAVRLLSKALDDKDAAVCVTPCYDSDGNVLSYSFEMYRAGIISAPCDAGDYSVVSVKEDAARVTIVFASGSSMSFPLVQKITSFVYIPEYSDGSAGVDDNGKAELCFEVFPSSAAEQLLASGTFKINTMDVSEQKTALGASLTDKSMKDNILTLSVKFTASSGWEGLIPYAEVAVEFFGQELSSGYIPLYKKF